MTEQNCDDSRKLTRLRDYSKGTIVFNTYCVPKCHVKQIECDIKIVFSIKYKLCRGTEWFKGNAQNMKKDIDMIIDKYCEHDVRSGDDDNKDSDDEYSTLDLDSLEVAEPTKTNLQETKCDEDYKQKYCALKFEYAKLQIKYDSTERINEFYSTAQSKLWDAFNKIVSK
jgi:hypothetical protein